jgi:uncharacterized protein YbjT (DUF2867 family)
MFAITGITGQVGGAVARALLAAGKDVRAVVRDEARGATWAERGCDVAVAAMDDTEALGAAFAGAEGVFVLLPPFFDPSPGFTEARSVIAAVRRAIEASRPGKAVCLSTVGAQACRPNLLQQLRLLEENLRTSQLPVTFLRAAWFMENVAWDVEPARSTGVIRSFLQPLDRPVPMVATADIGRVASELLQERWTGPRIVELEGPRRITPNDVAASLSRALDRDVRVELVARSTWEALFESQGMRNPAPRIQMLDGFNEGWIDFERGQSGTRKGIVSLDTVVATLVARASS